MTKIKTISKQGYTSVFTNGDDTCYYYIFSKSGFTKGLKNLADDGQVTLISLQEIYDSN